MSPLVSRSFLRRGLLATAGVVCVGLAAAGVVLPGLPTTIFLIAASWCFARSCPWLEERLIRVPLFRPFLGCLDGGQMPLRAVVITLTVMWTVVAASTVILLGGERPLIAVVVLAAAAVGTVFVIRLRAKRGGAGPRPL